MKLLRLLFACIFLLFLPGCWVFSLHPLYDELDTTYVFDPALVGTWSEPEGGCLLTLTSATEPSPSVYLVEYAAPAEKQGELCLVDPGKTLQFEGRLVQLSGHRFLDLGPAEKDICFQCLPTHSIYQVFADKDSLSLVPLDFEWLRTALQEKKLTLDTVEGRESLQNQDPITLTLPTKALRELVIKYADDKAAFKLSPNFTFKRK